jgi:RHS repeat-associated protein
VYDGTDPVVELDDQGRAKALNLFGGQELLARRTISTGGTTTGYEAYEYDAQGSVSVRLQGMGPLAGMGPLSLAGVGEPVGGEEVYEAYGEQIEPKQPPSRGEVVGNGSPWGYNARSGYYTDRETGLILCTYRYYDPEEGRFLNRDPIGYEGGANLYAYTEGNPTNDVDPDGTKSTGSYWGDVGEVFKGYGDFALDTINPFTYYNGAKALYSVGRQQGVGAAARALGQGVKHAYTDWYTSNDPRVAGKSAATVITTIALAAKPFTAPKRLPQDIAVNPIPPSAKNWVGRTVGRTPAQNKQVQIDAAEAARQGATDIRINQHQVNAAGRRVGINLPDLQYTLRGKRYYVEYDRPPAPRAVPHKTRLKANDPKGKVILKTM